MITIEMGSELEASEVAISPAANSFFCGMFIAGRYGWLNLLITRPPMIMEPPSGTVMFVGLERSEIHGAMDWRKGSREATTAVTISIRLMENWKRRLRLFIFVLRSRAIVLMCLALMPTLTPEDAIDQ